MLETIFDKEVIAFATDKKALGGIIGFDFVKETVKIMTANEDEIESKLEDVFYLEALAEFQGVTIFEHDVFAVKDSEKLWEIDFADREAKTLQMHLLNNKLERVESGQVFTAKDMQVLEDILVLIGNKYELEAVAPQVDFTSFNFMLVREDKKDGTSEYYYAYNNKVEEVVDLIKVINVGTKVLDGEHVRMTVSYEDFTQYIESDIFVEAELEELNTLTRKLVVASGQITLSDEGIKVTNAKCESPEQNDNFCEECGKDNEDCDCNLW